MTSLQRSSVSFRRQGSSGRIWNDVVVPERRSNMLNAANTGGRSGVLEEVFAARPHAESHPRSSPLSSESENPPPKCGLSSLFGRCMGHSRT
ncbi:hypothetical protein SAY87_021529 [Trapa incisa]|uniref:Uncharacterized protein n=1 Tax=Trapa incisa TaxID=236973 RepID=A0AAN7PRL9_9MYRT|nr:hypothetical protein SAY87_021529 [Trapa incisa]